MNPVYAQPDTPLSAVYKLEDLFHKYAPDPTYFEKRARHLHFTWDKSLIFKPAVDTVHVGEDRISREGVRYRQLPTANPHQLLFYVDGEQFESPENTGFEKGFEIVIANERECPEGLLIALAMVGDSVAWTVATDSKGKRIAACKEHGGQVELGKPTKTPEWPRLRRQGSTLGNAVRRLTRKLTGKGSSFKR